MLERVYEDEGRAGPVVDFDEIINIQLTFDLSTN